MYGGIPLNDQVWFSQICFVSKTSKLFAVFLPLSLSLSLSSPRFVLLSLSLALSLMFAPTVGGAISISTLIKALVYIVY